MADFLGKLGGSIDKGLKTISAKGKELVETAKLRAEIRDTEKAAEERFSKLGRRVFEMLNKGHVTEDDLRADAAEITNLFRKINELNETIRQVEEEAARSRHGADAILCPGCRAPNRMGERFCASCGAALSGPPTTGAATCPACSSVIKEGMKFCGKCGAKVG